MEMNTVHLALLRSAVELLFLVIWHIAVLIVTVLHAGNKHWYHDITFGPSSAVSSIRNLLLTLD
jgi:hypothetical protein